MCAPSWKVGLIGASWFIGWSCTLLWLPRLADIYGRKRLFCAGMLTISFLYVGILVTHSLNTMIALFFLTGALSSIRTQIGWVYWNEFFPSRLQNKLGTFYNMTDATVYMFATLYFWAGVKNWIYFALIGQVLAIFSAISSYFLPESPRYLLATKRYAALILVLEKIAKFNGKEPLDIDHDYFGENS